MKLVLSWLSDFIDLAPGTSVAALERALIQLGHEVEGAAAAGAEFPQVVVGRLLSRAPHPNADKLGVCAVEVGGGQVRQIVCGAPNARAGLTVAVALPGALLPGGVEIRQSRIRDVMSEGMLCSKRELGLGTEHEGIWEMDSGAAPGTPLHQALGGETVLEVAITPNRGDCLSHLGLARELAALGLGTLKPLPAVPAGAAAPAFAAAVSTADCPRLNLLELTGVANGESPAPVRARLEAAGLRPKNAVVDATNYTMLALGQPLHAYDAEKLHGPALTAAAAQGGEVFTGLGDTALTLAEGDVVITDASGVIGLGGILGSAASAVEGATTRVVLEAAAFNPVRIALTGQRHQVFTDARQRFERGVDGASAEYALRYCAALIRQWCGGQVSAVAAAGAGVPAPRPIAYRPAFFQRFIGLDVPAPRQRALLQALGFTVAPEGQGEAGEQSWQVTPPAYRTYMATPEDLTEEILRLTGYENVPPALPPAMAGQFGVNGAPVALDRTARRAMAAAGFLEVMTYSFIGGDVAAKFAGGAGLLALSNPLAQTDMTTMRPSLLPGLLGALAQNLAGSEVTPRLAEVGKVFAAGPRGRGEALMAAGVLTSSGRRHWQVAERAPDAFSAKAAALQVLATLGAPAESGQVTAAAPGHYHPGRAGTLTVGPFTLAHFGELHPALQKHFGLPPVAVFELHLEPLLKLQNKPRPWQPMPYPAVYRDLAFVLPQTVPAGEVQATLRATNRDLLREVTLFDRYVGAPLAPGTQSLAFSLTLQSAERTLTEADIAPILAAAVQAVEQKHQGRLRA